MKILFLENVLPYPLNNGGVMRSWNFIKALSPYHELSLLCLNSMHYRGDLSELKKYFKNIWIVESANEVPGMGIRKVKRIYYFLTGVPWEIFEKKKEFEDKLNEIRKNNYFDIYFARYLHNGKYLLNQKNRTIGKVIIDLDNIDPILNKRHLEFMEIKSRYKKFRLKLNNYHLFRYFPRLTSVDQLLVCSEEDKEYLRNNGLIKNVSVIPNAINTETYSHIKEINSHILGDKIILFCGGLDWYPNIDGLKWFVKEILPLINQKDQSVRLHLVGLNPCKEIYKLCKNKPIDIYPNVPSVLPFYEKSTLSIVPLRIGGGTRIKILESLAIGRPVVTTTIGVEGIPLENNKHCLIENNPQSFAFACLKLLNNLEDARKLAKAGKIFVADNYDIKEVSKKICDVINSL